MIWKRSYLLQYKSEKISLLDILEVSVGVHLEFSNCKFISHNDTVWMSLERRKCALVRICTFHCLAKSICLLMSERKLRRRNVSSQGLCRK